MTSLAIGLDVLMVFVLVMALSNAGLLLGPKPSHEGDAELPFETGLTPIEPAIGKMSVLYYRFAVLFVVFDVDLAFLLPWALCRREFNFGQAAAMTVFVALLGFMLAYFWRKGALECR